MKEKNLIFPDIPSEGEQSDFEKKVGRNYPYLDEQQNNANYEKVRAEGLRRTQEAQGSNDLGIEDDIFSAKSEIPKEQQGTEAPLADKKHYDTQELQRVDDLALKNPKQFTETRDDFKGEEVLLNKTNQFPSEEQIARREIQNPDDSKNREVRLNKNNEFPIQDEKARVQTAEEIGFTPSKEAVDYTRDTLEMDVRDLGLDEIAENEADPTLPDQSPRKGELDDMDAIQ